MGRGESAEMEAERAFAGILRAEQEAQDAVARCKAECEARVASAHRHSNQIAERAEQRISRLRDRIDAAAGERIAEIHRPAAAAAGGDATAVQLEGAVVAVTRELTGTA